MSRFVLDASVALKTLLVEHESATARHLLEDFRVRVHELIAPDVLPVEMGHALTRAERQNIIDRGQSISLFAEFLESCPRLFSYDGLFDRAMQLSSDYRIGLFDCLYVALAEEEQCKVVSADLKLVQLFPDEVISLDSLP